MRSTLLDNLSKNFITFEGGEGCGKSTQVLMLYEYFKSKNIPVIITREIGGTPEAEKIRDILLHSELFPTSELMMVMAARFEHVHKVIRPALKNNTFVICDRFVDSTAAYQGQCKNIGIDNVYTLHHDLIKLMPGTTFIIDIAPEIALERAKTRHDNNKFEDKNLEFHKNVYTIFKDISTRFQNRIVTIAAGNLNKHEVHEKIIQHLRPVIKSA